MSVFLFTVCCFFANILASIVTIVYGFKCRGWTGVFYTLAALGGSCFWCITGTIWQANLPIINNMVNLTIFFLWNSGAFLPWILLYCKYKSSEKPYRKITFAGIFTQIIFLAGITILAIDGDLQNNLDYISRYCGCLLLLFIAPGFILTWIAVVSMSARWKYHKISLTFVIVISALFFFLAGLGALRISV